MYLLCSGGLCVGGPNRGGLYRLHKEESFCAKPQKLSSLNKRGLLYTVAGARPTTVYNSLDGLVTSVMGPFV